MSQAIVERYLKAQIAEREASTPAQVRHRGHPFVTISREAGARGTTLADKLLEAFDEQADTALFGRWQVFDRRLCEIVAKDPSYRRSVDALLSEEYPSKTHDFFRQVIGSTVDHGILMDRVFQVVRALAALGKAIIVGRAGSQVTKGMPQGLRIRLVAPQEQRLRHLMDLEHLTERKARTELRKRDENRARLLKVHFDVDIADPAGYDVTWNTGTCSDDELVDATIALVKHRARHSSQHTIGSTHVDRHQGPAASS